MPKLSPSENSAVWKRSIWLIRAPLHFANHSQKEKHAQLHNQSAIKAFSEGLSKSDPSKLNMMEIFQAGIAGAGPLIQDRHSLLSEIQNQLLEWLKTSALQGYGFEGVRTLQSIPVALPSNLWAGFVSFDSNSLKYQSLEFNDIRVAHPSWISALLETTPELSKGTGRPSLERDLLNCFNALASEGAIDLKCTMSSHYPIIRKQLFKDFPEKYSVSRPLSDEGIRKYFSPFFQSLKEAP
jgi:hypothetical protein